MTLGWGGWESSEEASLSQLLVSLQAPNWNLKASFCILYCAYCRLPTQPARTLGLAALKGNTHSNDSEFTSAWLSSCSSWCHHLCSLLPWSTADLGHNIQHEWWAGCPDRLWKLSILVAFCSPVTLWGHRLPWCPSSPLKDASHEGGWGHLPTAIRVSLDVGPATPRVSRWCSFRTTVYAVAWFLTLRNCRWFWAFKFGNPWLYSNK